MFQSMAVCQNGMGHGSFVLSTGEATGAGQNRLQYTALLSSRLEKLRQDTFHFFYVYIFPYKYFRFKFCLGCRDCVLRYSFLK